MEKNTSVTSAKWVEALRPLSKPKFVGLTFSVLASLFLLFSAFLSYQSIQKNTETSLHLQAMGIEVVLLSLLKNFDLDFFKHHRAFLSDLILNERWEGVAFVALFLEDGRIVLHSNPNLIGHNVGYSPWLVSKRHTDYLRLQTGEVVFIYENEVPLKDFKGTLRIALHTSPVSESLEYAKLHIFLELIIALFFLGGGIILSLAMDKIDRDLKHLEEFKRWQFITKILLHEIKNPLATIKGYTQYLQKKEVDQSKNKALDLMLKETLRIEKLMQELSFYSYPVNPYFQDLDLRELIEELSLSFALIYPKGKIISYIEGEKTNIKSDPHLLRSVLTNLIDNALYASFEAGSREVHLYLKQEGAHLILEIKDFGPGIDKEALPRIFDPFFTTKAKGTGLGLAVVKKLCEALGIKLDIKSQKGVGTTVRLHFKGHQYEG